MTELADAVIVEFPLRGENWVAVNSPGDRIPSHGTDILAQRYAFDLFRTDDRPGLRYHPAGWLRTLVIGVPVRECYAWGQPIHAPFDGEVVVAADGTAERAWVHPVRELFLALRSAFTFTPEKVLLLTGNYVVIRGARAHAAFAHLAPGSVAVVAGEAVETGQVIGRVGHTGNSTTPHLHFQLMDGADSLTAHAVPCAFRAYEVWRDGHWERVENGVPKRSERIRSV